MAIVIPKLDAQLEEARAGRIDGRAVRGIVRTLAADPHARIIIRNYDPAGKLPTPPDPLYEFGCVLGAPPRGGEPDKRVKTAAVMSAAYLLDAFEMLADAVEARQRGQE